MGKNNFISFFVYFFIGLIFLLFLAGVVFGAEETPDKVGATFFQSLMNEDYLTCWQLIAEGSRQQILKQLQREISTDGTYYKTGELDYMMRTNQEGYQKVVFRHMAQGLATKMGLEVSDLKGVKVELVKIKGEWANIKLTAKKKTVVLSMKKYATGWQLVWDIPWSYW